MRSIRMRWRTSAPRLRNAREMCAKKLVKAAQGEDPEVSADPDANLLIGQWLDSRHSQVLPGDEYHASAEGKDPDLG